MENETQMRADFAAYTDEHGLLQLNSPPTPTDNGLLFTSEQLILYMNKGVFGSSDVLQMERAISACTPSAGLLIRHPSKQNFPKDNEGWDDYLAVSTVLYLSGHLDKARTYYDHGKGNSWCFQNGSGWAFNSCFLRYLDFVAHLHMCANEPIPAIYRTAWLTILKLARFKDAWDKDEWKLRYLMVQVAARYLSTHEDRGMSEAIAEWDRVFADKHPMGIGEVYRAYYPQGHPLGKWA